MKKVRYSVYQKLIVTIMSIVIGFETTKDINKKLDSEKLALNMFDMDTQINELIRRFGHDSINQLQAIHYNLFIENSNSAYSHKRVVVDCDQTDLIANGKTFELAEKGYFSKTKNQSGYQLSAAFTGKHSETVAMFLDSGNSHCTDHYDDLLKSIISKYKDQLNDDNLILRTDSGFCSTDNVEKLLSIPKLKFITKGYSTKTTRNLAKGIDYVEYLQDAKAALVYELPQINRVRYIIVQTLSSRVKVKYSLLITNISSNEMSAVELFHFYNERQTIETFFKMPKNVYHIRDLRTSKFH